MVTRANRLADESGFTLAELLVVVLIIGVLTAIAVPSFLNQKAKAEDGQAKVDARTAATTIESYYLEKDSYDADIANLEEIEQSLRNSTLTSVTGNDDRFTVTATSKSGTAFSFTRRRNGNDVRRCDPAGDGGCPANGLW